MGFPPVSGFSECIILRTCGQTLYYYFIPPTSVYIDLTHHAIVRTKDGKVGIKTVFSVQRLQFSSRTLQRE